MQIYFGGTELALRARTTRTANGPERPRGRIAIPRPALNGFRTNKSDASFVVQNVA